MTTQSLLVLSVGFLAQAFFSARMLVQWILSERVHRVLSPSLFWIFSVAGAYLLCIYGWMRDDFSIILGQFISYYVYLWNLKEKGIWRRLYFVLRAVLLLTPLVAVVWVVLHNETFINDLFRNENIPLWLVCFGSAGQILFTLRFVYQLFYSRRKGQSVLPAGFWIISMVGSLLIVSYGIIRTDFVLIMGQAVGLVAYARNLWIGSHPKPSSSDS